MIDLILFFALGLCFGALLGIGLGRRSSTANAAYDRIRAEAATAEAAWKLKYEQLKDQYDNLKAKR